MHLFTVFTPTYNRAYILPQLYNSLLQQTNQDFEWLIIDDGSTDETEELIQSYITEGKIKISYVRQENQGKHIAINNSMDIIQSEYFITVDSDDYLLPNAIEVCYDLVKNYSEIDNLGGFSFLNYLGRNDLNFNNYGKIKSFNYHELKFDIKAEKTLVLKTKIARKFKFPVYKNEKFCQESYMLIQIMDRYPILYTDYILARGEYLEDGLSQNLYKRLLENPRYTLETLKLKYKSKQFNAEQKKHFAINFWDITLKTKAVNPFFQLFNFPIIGTLSFLQFKILNFRKN